MSVCSYNIIADIIKKKKNPEIQFSSSTPLSKHTFFSSFMVYFIDRPVC